MCFFLCDSGVRVHQQEVHVPRGETGLQEVRGQPAKERLDAGPGAGRPVAQHSRVPRGRSGRRRGRSRRHHDQPRVHAL